MQATTPQLFDLKVGETYAILPDNTTVHQGGTFIGYLALEEGITWLAFESTNDTVRFYNPALIRSLLPESDPRI